MISSRSFINLSDNTDKEQTSYQNYENNERPYDADASAQTVQLFYILRIRKIREPTTLGKRSQEQRRVCQSQELT
jgi:hypothetical protein